LLVVVLVAIRAEQVVDIVVTFLKILLWGLQITMPRPIRAEMFEP